jgi:hypothetical protein
MPAFQVDFEVVLQRIGDQPQLSDTPHGRRARFHQSWYRAFRLGIDGWGTTRSGRPVGSILPPDAALAGRNFTSASARDLFLLRRAMGWGVDPVRMTSHMTSSQTLLVNLLAPMLQEAAWLRAVLRRALDRPDITAVSRSEIEFAPRARSEYLGDMTRVDALFWIEASNGPETVVLELKYADRFSSRRVDLLGNLRYASLANDSGLWREPALLFGNQQLNQLVRCHALAARTIQVESRTVSPATLLLVAHPHDSKAFAVYDTYRGHLVDPGKAKFVTLDMLISMAISAARSREQIGAMRRLEQRYLDHHLSESLWREHLGTRSR